MPYTDGLGAAIALAPTQKLYGNIDQSLLAKLRAAAAAKAANKPTPILFKPKVVPVLKPNVPGIVPVLPPPVVDYMPAPQTPVIIAQGLPYPAAGGGTVTSGAPSPVLTTPGPAASGDLILDDSTPSVAGMSPIMMLLLAGLAVGFLLKKKR